MGEPKEYRIVPLRVSHFLPICLTAEAKFCQFLDQKYENSYSLSKLSKKVSNK